MKKALPFILIFAILFVCWLTFASVRERQKNRTPDVIDAYVACQDVADDSLKAPAEAEYPTMASGEVEVDTLTESWFIIRSYVDAPNSFGVQLRQRFQCDAMINVEDGTIRARVVFQE